MLRTNTMPTAAWDMLGDDALLLPMVTAHACKLLSEIFESERVGVFLVDEERGRLTQVEDSAKGGSLKFAAIGTGVAGRVAKDGCFLRAFEKVGAGCMVQARAHVLF